MIRASEINGHYDVKDSRISAAANIVTIVGEAIKELGNVPSGVLYAQLCGHFSLETYNSIINALEMCGVISVKNYMITYIGGI